MSNKLLLNLLQKHARQQAYSGGCYDMEGGVFTDDIRIKAKEMQARKKAYIESMIPHDAKGKVKKTFRENATIAWMKLREKEKANAPKKPRDPNAQRKKYPRKPRSAGANEGRIQALMDAKKINPACSFTKAQLRKKIGQEDRLSRLERDFYGSLYEKGAQFFDEEPRYDEQKYEEPLYEVPIYNEPLRITYVPPKRGRKKKEPARTQVYQSQRGYGYY